MSYKSRFRNFGHLLSITLKHVADELGVSQMTVSYALRDHPSISAGTRERVKGAAKKLGYRPNSAARAMLTGQFRTIASVYTVTGEGVRQTSKTDLLAGYSVALHEARMQLVLAAIDPTVLGNAKDGKPSFLRERTVDGLLIDYDVRISSGLMRELSQLLVPYICVNDKQKSDCVYPDDAGGARDATERLIALGHKRILCYIDDRTRGEDGELLHYSSADRASGYRMAMESSGLRSRIVRPNVEDELAHLQVRSLLAGRNRPSAILCAGSGDPYKFLHHAVIAGLKVPEDLSLVTIHHEQPQALALIATWHIPFRQTGYLSAKHLLEKTRRPALRLKPVAVPYSVVSDGQTLAPPARHLKTT